MPDLGKITKISCSLGLNFNIKENNVFYKNINYQNVFKKS